MTIPLSVQMKRKLDNTIAGIINTLSVVRNSPNITIEDKLKSLETVGQALPEVRRMLIFFLNQKKGN